MPYEAPAKNGPQIGIVGTLSKTQIFAIFQIDTEFPWVILAQNAQVCFFFDFTNDLVPFAAVVAPNTLPR